MFSDISPLPRHDHSRYIYCHSVIWSTQLHVTNFDELHTIHTMLAIIIQHPFDLMPSTRLLAMIISIPLKASSSAQLSRHPIHPPTIATIALVLTLGITCWHINFAMDSAQFIPRLICQRHHQPPPPLSNCHPGHPHKTIPFSINPNFHNFPCHYNHRNNTQHLVQLLYTFAYIRSRAWATSLPTWWISNPLVQCKSVDLSLSPTFPSSAVEFANQFRVLACL